MTNASLLRGKLRRLEKEIEEFERDYSPEGIMDRMRQLKQKMGQFRSQGYTFLEDDIEGAADRIISMVQDRRDFLNSMMNSSIRRLLGELQQASFYTNLDNASESVLERADKETDDAERKLKDARKNYIDGLDPLQETEKRINKMLKRIPYYFQMRDEASFDFNSGEQVVMADKAEWVVTGNGKEDPDGILFLTNQRIVFEQKETTGKKFGLFGGKKQHGIQWEYATDQIANASFEDQGMLGRKDMLMLQMQSGAEHPEITLESKGDDDNSEWFAVIDKAIKGTL